jgi:hypothetical protein
MEHWTSKSKVTFSAMTLHFINDFEFVSQTLCCQKKNLGSTTSVNIYTQFVSDLKEWVIKFEDCVGVVSNTAANMNSFRQMLEKKYGIPHHYCINHILQLTVCVVVVISQCVLLCPYI